MSKLIRHGDIQINKLESAHIIKSFKEIKDLKFNRDNRCSIRAKANIDTSGAVSYLCPIQGCASCFYKAGNFLNVHKLIKKIKNEQANKLSKA